MWRDLGGASMGWAGKEPLQEWRLLLGAGHRLPIVTPVAMSIYYMSVRRQATAEQIMRRTGLSFVP